MNTESYLIQPYIYPGIEQSIHPRAKPLFNLIQKEINKIGSQKLAVEYLLLENQEIFGFKETEIKTRIRNYNYALSRKKNNCSPKIWKDYEIAILINNQHKTAWRLKFMLKRTVYAIQSKRQKLRKAGKIV